MNNFTVKLNDVLMMSDMKINFLFMQILKMQKIINQQELYEYEFYKNNIIIAKDIHHSKTSYLIWIWKLKILYMTNSARKTVYLAADKIISIKTLHQKLDYSEKKKLIQMKNNIKNLEIIDMKNLLKNCKICIKIKKTKLQQYSAMIWTSQLLKQIHMNIWEFYHQENITRDEYILIIINNCTRYKWVFSIKNKSSKMIKILFKKWKKKIECQTDKKIKKIKFDNSKYYE